MADKPDKELCARLANLVSAEIASDKVSNRIVRGRIDGQSHLEALWIVAMSGSTSVSFSVDVTEGPTNMALDRKVKDETMKLDADRWPGYPSAATAREAIAPAWDAGLTTVAALSIGKNKAGEEQVLLWYSPAITPSSAVLLLKTHLQQLDSSRMN